MYLYTTPTITILMPREVPVLDITSLKVTIKQDTVNNLDANGNKPKGKIKKSLSEVALDGQANSIAVTLTQDETAKFVEGTLKVQCHFAIGSSVMATKSMYISVYENIDGEALPV